TNSSNEVSTAYGVSTFSGHNSQKEGSSLYTGDLMYYFFANQSSGPQLDHEDLKQVDEFYLEERDLKWHFASECRSKGNKDSRRRDVGNTGYKVRDNGSRLVKQDEHKVMVTIDGESVDWTGHAKDDTEDYALMAFNSSNSGLDTEVKSCSKVCAEYYAKLMKLYDEQREQLGVASIEIQACTLALKRVEAQLVFSPPMIEIYMPPKFDFGIDESKFTYDPKNSKTSKSDAKPNNLDSCESSSSVETLESVPKPIESKPKVITKPKVWSDAPIIEEYELDSDDEYVFKAGTRKSSGRSSLLEELERLKRQEKEADDAAKTLKKMFAQITTASTPVNTTSPLTNVSAAGLSYPDLATYDNQDDSQIPSLEDIYDVSSDGIFISTSSKDEDVVADFTNLESTMNVSPIPQSRIHFIHLTTQILGDPTATVQTRSKVKKSSRAHAFIEPKKISQALEDKSWVDAIQEELLQFKTQQVWILVDLPFGKKDKYVAEILNKFDFLSVKTASTSIETKKPLVKDEEAVDVDLHLYRSMIGSLMYLTASRLDIMYAVCTCSTFQVTPKTSHHYAVKRIFRYLKGHLKLGLWYPKESTFDLEAYLDDDYAGANLDKKSITRGCQFLCRRLTSWQCKKQTIVATLTTEAEYVAAAS
nr:hypothetical protein [Tanacetum cinerariifolium]